MTLLGWHGVNQNEGEQRQPPHRARSWRRWPVMSCFCPVSSRGSSGDWVLFLTIDERLRCWHGEGVTLVTAAESKLADTGSCGGNGREYKRCEAGTNCGDESGSSARSRGGRTRLLLRRTAIVGQRMRAGRTVGRRTLGAAARKRISGSSRYELGVHFARGADATHSRKTSPVRSRRDSARSAVSRKGEGKAWSASPGTRRNRAPLSATRPRDDHAHAKRGDDPLSLHRRARTRRERR